MKNYLVKALINFNDNEENGAKRTPEDTFYCTKERFEFLREHNAVMLLEIKKEEKEPQVNLNVNVSIDSKKVAEEIKKDIEPKKENKKKSKK